MKHIKLLIAVMPSTAASYRM